MGYRKPHYVKQNELQGTGREAQEDAQLAARIEFMDAEALPKPYRIMFNFATGTGKGKTAIECAIDYYNQVSKKPLFIGCFTEKQRDKLWVNELAKWGRMHHIVQYNVRACYASFRKIKGLDLGVVILDEAHHLSEGDWEFFENNKFEAVIVLTATEPRSSDKKKLLRRLTYGRRMVIKNDDAIKAEVLNDFKVHIMQVQPDTTKRFKLEQNNNVLYNEWTGYLRLCYLYDKARESSVGERIRFAHLRRMRFLGNSETKTRAAIYIQNQIKAKNFRFVTIAASIEQTSKLGPYICHSKTSKVDYDRFCAGRINELISVNQLKEGENFENLGRMVYVQPDGNPSDFEQLKGRAQRLPIDQISIIYIIVMKGTMDERWVKKSLENTPADKIKYFNLDKELYWPTKDHENI